MLFAFLIFYLTSANPVLYSSIMKVQFGTMNGEVTLSFVPENHEELRELLRLHEHEAFCPDCEATLDDPEEDLCPTCGEGVGAEPEFTKVRPKSA